jgi:seryl-tRNA synthetase
MLDIKFLRNNLDLVSGRLKTKGFVFDSETFLALDAQRKQADVISQSLQAERKQVSKKVGQLISQGKTVDESKAEVAETLKYY